MSEKEKEIIFDMLNEVHSATIELAEWESFQFVMKLQRDFDKYMKGEKKVLFNE